MVHTIGTLFEKSGYKSALKDGNVPRFVSSIAAGVAGAGAGANPLEREERRREGSYEVVNRDTGASCWSGFVVCDGSVCSLIWLTACMRTGDVAREALRVCEAFLSSKPTVELAGPRAFVYISAEDCNRPVVPSGYIRTKREAEMLIGRMVQEQPGYRAVYIRPSAYLFCLYNVAACWC